MTDRELLLAWEDQKKLDTQTLDQTQQYQAVALGLVLFCQTFLVAVQDPEQNLAAVTRQEAVQLLVAAIQGR